MPRLSIVIPNIGFDASVEQTLVSVLQNRPEYSEVLVVTSQPYDDPFELGREVRFLTHSESTTRLELINHGCREADGDVVHLLLPGAVAVDGWTDRVLHHFTDDKVAAVASCLMPNTGWPRAIAYGVGYSTGGKRRILGAGVDPNGRWVDGRAILAPMLVAGFFRNDVLAALHGFDCELGESLADVELGLALRDLGLSTTVEPQSRVVVGQAVSSTPRTSNEAQCAERLFRRQMGKSTSIRHLSLVASEFLCGFPHARMLTRLWGRLAASREANPRTRYEARLERARAEMQRVREARTTIRGDFDGANGIQTHRPSTKRRGRRSAA